MTNKNNATVIARAFSSLNFSTVVVSPGSRNAPIIKALQHEEIELLSVVDERCAAFFALGIAQATHKAVGLVCTSGTALLNYAPAIAEAYYQGVPLIVMSADRPGDKINTGEGQSIDQRNVYQNFQKSFMNLPEDIEDVDKAYSQVKSMLQQSVEAKMGPVHVNLPFEEPLYDEGRKLSIQEVDLSVEIKSEANFSALEKAWEIADKRLILCGIHAIDSELEPNLTKLHEDGAAIVLHEAGTNVDHQSGIGNIDRCLSVIDAQKCYPSLLITIGEHVVSKRIKQFLRNSEGVKHFHINAGGVDQNTFGVLQETICVDAATGVEYCSGLNSTSNPEFIKAWKSAAEIAKARHDRFLLQAPYSDLAVFEEILKNIPKGWNVQSGNSSVVRYVQLFDYDQWSSFHANRGTSGIDGSTSTAIGFARENQEPTILISGDISFLYDSNALWNKHIPAHFRIIVVNNGGGGIFRFIPGPQTVDGFEEIFETQHKVQIEGLVKSYGLDYLKASSLTDLNAVWAEFYAAGPSAKVLEVFTPNELNAEVLKDYFSFIQEK